MNIQNDHSLENLNTFGVKAHAKYFAEINCTEDLIDILKSKKFAQEQSLILGGGSNLLFTSDFDGLILKVQVKGIHVVKEDDDYFWVKAGGGVVWQELVESCIKANFGGIENLSLIPGTVGAAPIQNIGAYGVEIKDYCEAVEAIDLENGEKRYFSNHECHFGYRDSIFKNELRDRYLITNVLFRLLKRPILNIDYGQVRSTLEDTGKTEFTIRDVSEAIIRIRTAKLPDPAKIGNAGSFFKNPVISRELFNAIKKSFPEIPHYDQPDSSVKIPAAWMIDQCGLKGKKHNSAAVHKLQPLVIINEGGATGDDIVKLSEEVQQKVKNKFGIQLEPEVRFI